MERDAAILARSLDAHGVRLVRTVIVGDELEALRDALTGLLAEGADLVCTTGGLGPTHDDLTMEVVAEVTHAGRTSLEAKIEVFAEPLAEPIRRKVGVGYGLYVALDAQGHPCPVPPLACETETDRQRDLAAKERQAIRLARREEARRAT